MEWIALQLWLQVCDASSAAGGRNWTQRFFFFFFYSSTSCRDSRQQKFDLTRQTEYMEYHVE